MDRTAPALRGAGQTLVKACSETGTGDVEPLAESVVVPFAQNTACQPAGHSLLADSAPRVDSRRSRFGPLRRTVKLPDSREMANPECRALTKAGPCVRPGEALPRTGASCSGARGRCQNEHTRRAGPAGCSIQATYECQGVRAAPHSDAGWSSSDSRAGGDDD